MNKNTCKLIEMERLIIRRLGVVIFLCVLLMSSGAFHAQAQTDQQNSTGLLKKANIAYRDLKFAVAADYYETYLQNMQGSQDTVIAKLADCYLQMREYDRALREYKKIYNEGIVGETQQQKLKIAELFARKGEYRQASDLLLNVDGYKTKAQAYGQPKMLDAMKKDSLNWNLSFLNINTSEREFSPCLVGNTLLFSSNKALPTKKDAFGWDGKNYSHLWKIPVASISAVPVDQMNESMLAKAQKSQSKARQLAEVYEQGDTKPMNSALGLLINKPTMKGDPNSIGTIVSGLDKIKLNAGAISVDKNNKVYFSSNYPKADKKGVNRICLMEAEYSSTGVSKIKQLPFGDPNSYSVMHPAVNSDGTFMVCSSDMPNGQGGYDLYYTERDDSSKPWSKLNPLNASINTIGNEVFPTITTNGYLYFSSDAMPGLGGLDIYRVLLQDVTNGNATPEHLSYPVNSSSDDFGWTQDSTAVRGYFTSDRVNSNDNLYSFYFEIKKIKGRLYVEGFVLDKQTAEPIETATVFMLNKADNKVTVAKSDKDGKFRFPISNQGEVVIKAIKKGHSDDCLSMTTTVTVQDEDIIQKTPHDLLLDKYKIGYTWKLNNIHYDFDKSFIRKDARPILDSLVTILNTYPINVELGSHTDSRGSNAYNIALAQRRADAAVAYLINSGIDSQRIKAKGYGETQLLNKCSDGVPCSKEAHQENRRTEVKVLSLNIPQSKSPELDLDKFKAGEVVDKDEFPNGFFDNCK